MPVKTSNLWDILPLHFGFLPKSSFSTKMFDAVQVEVHKINVFVRISNKLFDGMAVCVF